MKLKKIVSLALAGVLAVSMLAGCKNDGSSSSSSSEVVTTPTTGIAAALNDVRSDYVEDILKLTYTESSSLTEILKDAAQDKYGKDTAAIKAASGYKTAELVNDAAFYQEIADQLVGTVNITGAPTTVGTKGTTKYLKVYIMGGDYTMATVGNGITDAANGLKDLTDAMQIVSSGNASKATYSADVAAVKIVNPDDSTETMWVVAVVFTQTVA